MSENSMEKINEAETFSTQAIQVVKELLNNGQTEGVLDAKSFPNLKVILSVEKPETGLVVTVVTPPDDMKDALGDKDIYIVTAS